MVKESWSIDNDNENHPESDLQNWPFWIDLDDFENENRK